MGRVAKRHAELIESIAEQVAIAYESSDNSDLAAQAVVIPYVEALYRDAESGAMAKSTLIKGVLPALWREVGEAIGATAEGARNRLFLYDIATRGRLPIADDIKGLRLNDNSGYSKTVTKKLDAKCPITSTVMAKLNTLFTSWLTDTAPKAGTETEEIVRLILAISWHTGRRPWSETAYTAKFEVTKNPRRWDWLVDMPGDPDYDTNFEIVSVPEPDPGYADAWIHFLGNCKWTRKEHLNGAPLPLDIPVVGVTGEQVVEALARLRQMESRRSWFRPDIPVDKLTIGSSLQYAISQVIADCLDPILQPLYEAGAVFPDTKDGKFTSYHLRPLYACRMGVIKEATTGKRPDPTVMAKHLLGHRGTVGTASLAYQSFEYVQE